MQVHPLEDRLGSSPEDHDHALDGCGREGRHSVLEERSAFESRELLWCSEPPALTRRQNEPPDHGRYGSRRTRRTPASRGGNRLVPS
jgi:hypothetical protein